MIIQILGIWIAILGFAILIETPKKYLGLAAFVGAIGGAGYLVSVYCGIAEAGAYFISAFLVTVAANIFAKFLKTPVSAFLIAGILPTVPGSGVYRVAYNIIIGELDWGLYYFVETLKYAGAISLAIFIAETIFRVIMRRTYLQKE